MWNFLNLGFTVYIKVCWPKVFKELFEWIIQTCRIYCVVRNVLC
jgi:hypothetical protein